MPSKLQARSNSAIAVSMVAGQKAVDLRDQGYHCSEAVFLAVNNTFQIADPSLVRLLTGYHGGGGTHRLVPGINLTELLSRKAAGYQQVAREDLPVEQVGHLCGALAAGIACLGLLFGRRSPGDDLTCVDELCFELHRRFMAAFGYRECRLIREYVVPHTPSKNCEVVYRQAAELTAQLIQEAHLLVPECPSLQPQAVTNWESACSSGGLGGG